MKSRHLRCIWKTKSTHSYYSYFVSTLSFLQVSCELCSSGRCKRLPRGLRHQADSESLHERDGSIDKLLAAIDKSEKFNEYFPGTGGCYFSMGVTSIDLDNI